MREDNTGAGQALETRGRFKTISRVERNYGVLLDIGDGRRGASGSNNGNEEGAHTSDTLGAEEEKDGGEEEGDAAAEREESVALARYGQLRMRHVLWKRRREAGNVGPSDLLIVQPTSIGNGIDAGFVEVRVSRGDFE